MNQIQIRYNFQRGSFSVDSVELKLAYKHAQPAIRDLVAELNGLQEAKQIPNPDFISLFCLCGFLFYGASFFKDQFIFPAYGALIGVILVGSLYGRGLGRLQAAVQRVCDKYLDRLKDSYLIRNNFSLANGVAWSSNNVILEPTDPVREVILDSFSNTSEVVVMGEAPALVTHLPRHPGLDEEPMMDQSVGAYKFMNLPETAVSRSHVEGGNNLSTISGYF